MNIQTTVASAVALVALGTISSTSVAATGREAALDACVKSFVQTYLPERKVRYVTQSSPGRGLYSLSAPREYVIALSARGVDSGELIAEAQCVASRDGIVVVLESPTAGNRHRLPDYVVSLR